jgi:hypothetical protein
VKEYDVFLPLDYNDGSPVEPEKFEEVKQRLLERFEGVTYFPQANEGAWRSGEVTYHDRIVIFRVLAEDAAAAREFLASFKGELKESFRQKAILIIERDVEIL